MTRWYLYVGDWQAWVGSSGSMPAQWAPLAIDDYRLVAYALRPTNEIPTTWAADWLTAHGYRIALVGSLVWRIVEHSDATRPPR